MTIDTQKKVIAIQLRRMIVMVVFILVILYIFIFLDSDGVYFGLSQKKLGIFWTCLYLIYIFTELFLDYKYIFFNDETNRIVLRYFSLGYFNRQKNSIEIPKEEFKNYELTKSLFGLKYKIVLIREFKSKEARYPAVSLSILNKKQLDLLDSALNRYILK
jgi:hypothetical protein